jgi:hypothetical protein
MNYGSVAITVQLFTKDELIIQKINSQVMQNRSRDSAVVIATGYRLNGQGVEIHAMVGASRPVLWPNQSPTQWVPVAFSPGG